MSPRRFASHAIGVCALLLGSRARAAMAYSWANPVDGTFEDGTNWIGGAAPLLHTQEADFHDLGPQSFTVQVGGPPNSPGGFVNARLSIRAATVAFEYAPGQGTGYALEANDPNLPPSIEVIGACGAGNACAQGGLTTGMEIGCNAAAVYGVTGFPGKLDVTGSGQLYCHSGLTLGPNASGTFEGYSSAYFDAGDLETIPGSDGTTMTIRDDAFVKAASIHNNATLILRDAAMLTTASMTNAGTFQFMGGALFTHSFAGTPLVQTGGQLSPGDDVNSSWVLTSTDYTLGPGALVIRLGGTTRGSNYAALSAPSITLLNGSILQVGMVSIFQPAAGQTFDILDFASIQGHFSTLQLQQLPTGLAWDTSNLYVDGTIRIYSVPPPPKPAPAAGPRAIALLAAVLLLAGLKARRAARPRE